MACLNEEGVNRTQKGPSQTEEVMSLRSTVNIPSEKAGDIVLECQDLAYRYPNGKTVFRDVNLFTSRDEFICVIGPTGTGKSTLLRVIAHLIPPTSGRVMLDGVEVTEPSSRISLVHQSIATFPWMTALDNVKIIFSGSGISDQEATRRSEKTLSLVGLGEAMHLYPKEMSGGMRQRVAIARALAASPEVLLLDEPFVHLDELTANEIRKEVYDLVFNPNTTLKSAVLVSHNLHEVVQLADRVYVMNGSPSTIVDVVKIEMPRPRTERDPRFLDYVETLYADLSTKVSKV
jgi:NitT/TauT family transport system ATP-binding protein